MNSKKKMDFDEKKRRRRMNKLNILIPCNSTLILIIIPP